MTTTSALDNRDDKRYAQYALAILTLVNFLNYIDRQILPAVAPILSTELRLTDTELGALEAALLLSFTFLAPIFGHLGDHRSRTKLMAGAAVIWSIATALTGVADLFPWLPPSVRVNVPLVHVGLTLSGVALILCFVRAFVGVGESSYSTITPSLIADFFPPRLRATALGIFQAAIPMGFALGYVIGGLLAHFFGWRAAFMVVALPGIITASFVWRLREPKRGAGEIDQAEPGAESRKPAYESAYTSTRTLTQGWRHISWGILKTPDWALSTAGYTALTFVLGAFALWAPTLLVRDKHMSTAKASIALGIVTLLGGAAGTFGGGWLADRIYARRIDGYYLVCATSSFLGIIPTVLALVARNEWVYLPSIFVAVMFLFANNAPFHAILINSVPPLVRATAVALNIVIIHSFGDLISRFGVGVLSDSLGAGRMPWFQLSAGTLGIDGHAEHLTAALLVAPIALLVSSFFFGIGAIRQNRKERWDRSTR